MTTVYFSCCAPRRSFAATLLVLLLSLVLSSEALAERPKIGLALAGGGARGAAHIGVLRVIEELGIQIDYVAGNSMGAIVAGLYAMGNTPEQIEQAVREIDWDDIFQDRAPRPDRRMRDKLDDRLFLSRARAGVEGTSVNVLPALIQGQKLDLALRRYTAGAGEIRDFDELPIPFRAVATDVVSGDAVVLAHGDLATAIRASMAVPAVFAPVELDGRLLVDGLLVMNLPVEVVRDMGADIVIAVDVSGPRRARDEIRSALEMLDQVMAVVTWNNTKEQMAQLREGRDLLIVPPLGREVTAGDFDKQIVAIDIGERAARDMRPQLARLASGGDERVVERLDDGPPVIDFIRIENDSRLSDRGMRERISQPVGQPLDRDAVERDIAGIYEQGIFESVRYSLVREGGRTGLVVSARKSPWGTNSIQPGISLSTRMGGDSRFSVGLAYTHRPLNRYNGEWRTIAAIGSEPRLVTELYQPLDPHERWFVNPGIGWLSKSINVYGPDSKGRALAQVELDLYGGYLAFGRNISDWGRLSMLYRRYGGSTDVAVGSPVADILGSNLQVGTLSVQLIGDRLDNLGFPTRGWAGRIGGSLSREVLGASDEFTQAGVELIGAKRFGSLGLIGSIRAETTFDGPPSVDALYRLGGFLNLSGFAAQELTGRYAGLLRTAAIYDLGGSLVRTYAGGSLEYGNAWRQRGDVDVEDGIFAGSLFVGADTVLGPIYLGYGHAEAGNRAFYLMLGRPWLALDDP